jgi:paraquat-inducible protein B
MAEKIDNLQKLTPAQFNKSIDRGLKEMESQISNLSKRVLGAKTIQAGMLSQTNMGRETMVANQKRLDKLKEEYTKAKQDSIVAKNNYPKVLDKGDFVTMTVTPDEHVSRWPYTDMLMRPHRGRKASESSEK